MDLSAEFKRWKAQCLSKADLSRKGSVDEDVLEIVQLLNGQEQFFTTSSCAGRIILLDGSVNGSEVQKQNCCWLLVTHKACVKGDVIVALKKAKGDAVLKFEPLVLHVQCRQLQDAQILHSVAIDSGFRNSGITVGKRGKIMLVRAKSRVLSFTFEAEYIMRNAGLEEAQAGIKIARRNINNLRYADDTTLTAESEEELNSVLMKVKEAVRSTHGLEVPLSHQGKLMVTEEYINFVLKIANQKMEENKKRIERFYHCLQHALEKETVSTTSHPKEKVNTSYIHKKKRNPAKACGKRVTEENDTELENNDHDDPGISVTIFPEDY